MSTPTVRTLLQIPRQVRKGEAFEVRVTIGHPMETGYRPGVEGAVADERADRPAPAAPVRREVRRGPGQRLGDRHRPAVVVEPDLPLQHLGERGGGLG